MTARAGARLGAVVLMVWFAVPLVPVVWWAFADRWTFPAVLPQQWGVRGWDQALAADLLPAVGRSILLGAVVAALSVVLGAACGRTLAWSRGAGARWRGVLGFILLAPVALPPFALAMGLDVLLLRLQIPSTVALVALLTVFALPYTTYTLRAGFLALDPELEEQARLLGAGPQAAFLRVTLPALVPALAAAGFLAFVIGWSDYVITLVIGGGQFTTLPLLIGSAAARTGNESLLAVLSVVSVVLPLAALVFSGLWTRRSSVPSTREEDVYVG